MLNKNKINVGINSAKPDIMDFTLTTVNQTLRSRQFQIKNGTSKKKTEIL